MFGISTPKRVAAFLAHVGHESASLTKTVENLNYGAQGMADTWPSRYAVDPKAKPREPNDLARALVVLEGFPGGGAGPAGSSHCHETGGQVHKVAVP